MFCNEVGFTIQVVEGEVQEDLLDYGMTEIHQD
jgi:hypothetical protein